MITFTTNAAQVAKNIRALEERMKAYREDFLNWAQRRYQRRARLVVRTVVYGAYSPSVYRRTGRLRRSIRVNRTKRGITIWQDPQMTKTVWRSWYRGYAHYMIDPQGSFLMQPRMPASLRKSLPRNFLRVWRLHFRARFAREYQRQVIRRAFRSRR